MNFYKKNITILTKGRGFHELTSQLNSAIQSWGVQEGLAFLFVPHTSASLVINESYAGSAQRDMETFLDRVAPEGENWYQHTMEGRDDSPAHLRTMITPSSITIPIDQSHLSLGTWQGVFLAEHRRRGHQRQILLRVLEIGS